MCFSTPVNCVLKENMVEVSGGGLGHVYSTLQFHFHWASTASDSVGSEHLVDSKRYPMEVEDIMCHIFTSSVRIKSCGVIAFVQLHIVNKRKDLTLDEAVTTDNGLAVLGFFIEVMCNTKLCRLF